MMTVLVYDVVSNRRRSRFFRRLKRHLHRVQKSVFEGMTTPAELDKVELLAERELDLEVDRVRIYTLCRACAGLSVVLGGGPDVPNPDAPIIL